MPSSRLSINMPKRQNISRQDRVNIESSPLGMKRLFLICTVFSIFLSSSASAAFPYFRVNNGDVFTGGWFNNGASSCGATNYQYPSSVTSATGGIMAFSNSSRQGSGANQAVFSLGAIEASAANNYGFFSNPNGYNSNTYANSYTGLSLTTAWGGYLDNGALGTRCIPDYYSTKQNSPSNLGAVSSSYDLSSIPANGQYSYTTNGVLTLTASSTFSKKATIFVSGDVYIKDNIKYPASYTDATVPKLALIVLGNIFVDPNVDTLTGLFIAQPNYTTAAGGGFWTCHDNTQSAPSDVWVTANCNRQTLTVNGAVTAKQIILLRTLGDISNSTTAETFNFTPEMIIGGPMIYGASNTQNGSIKSLISLPPVY